MRAYSKGWMSIPLEQLIVQIVGGGTPSKSNVNYFRGTKPFMTVKDMRERFPTDTIDHISEEAINSSATKVVPADTLIIATRMSLGKIVRPTFDTAINQDLKALFFANGIDKTFAEHWWRSRASHIQSLGTGTTVKGIRLEDIHSLQMDLPPSNEQKRIADKLDAILARVDACRERLDRIPVILKRFRQAVLAVATSGKLTEEWRLERSLTDEWHNMQIKEITAKVGSGATPKGGEVAYKSNGIPLIRSMNVIFYGFKYDGLAYLDNVQAHDLRNAEVHARDVLLNITGASIGRVTLAPKDMNGARVNQHVCIIRPKDILVPEFLCWLLAAPKMQSHISGENYGVTRQALTKQQILDFEVPVPSMDEQIEIIRRVESLFAYADSLEARYTASRAQVDKLIPATLAKAFRGELVPQDPNDEPASILLERIKASRANIDTKPKRASKSNTNRVLRKLKETTTMTITKSRQDDDVKGKSYLAEHLRNLGGSAQVEVLFEASDLPVADFYKQLAWEIAEDMIRDAGKVLELGNAA